MAAPAGASGRSSNSSVAMRSAARSTGEMRSDVQPCAWASISASRSGRLAPPSSPPPRPAPPHPDAGPAAPVPRQLAPGPLLVAREEPLERPLGEGALVEQHHGGAPSLPAG